MNYYKRHLGDYAKNTRTLSTYEHGVYNLVLDLYYTDESPVSSEDAYLICRADSSKDRAMVDRVLNKFFQRDGDTWRNDRADEEIEKYRDKSEKNRVIGSLGGKQKAKRNASETLSDSEEDRLANDTPSHKPLATSQYKEAPVVPKGDASEAAVLAAYHAILPRCQAVAVLGPKRKRRIAAACKQARDVCREQGWPYDPHEFWTAFFTECSKDEWLRGDKPNPKNAAWRQKLDTLVDEERFTQVMDRAIASMRGEP